MRIAGLKTLDTNDADKLAIAVYFQGCSMKCKGCHNPDLQDQEGGVEMSVQEILDFIEEKRDWHGAVVFLGGEPMEQMADLYDLLIGIHGLDKWLYTGWDYNCIPHRIVDECDVIVAGAFVEELATGSFPASSNQIVDDRRG